MKKSSATLSLAFAILSFIIILHSISAYTYLNIYLDNSGKADFLGETNGTNQTLSLPQGIIVQDSQISGTTQDLTTKVNETWRFIYSLKGAEMKVILPPGSTLQNLSQGQIFLERERIVVYFKDNVSLQYMIPDAKFDPTSLLAIIVILIFAIAIVSYHYRKKITGFFGKKREQKGRRSKPEKKATGKDDKRQRKLELIKQVLNPREKIVIDNLENHGRIKMSHLRKLSGIPKASFSRHVQELERKGLLKKTGEGKNKFVEMAK